MEGEAADCGSPDEEDMHKFFPAQTEIEVEPPPAKGEQIRGEQDSDIRSDSFSFRSDSPWSGSTASLRSTPSFRLTISSLLRFNGEKKKNGSGPDSCDIRRDSMSSYSEIAHKVVVAFDATKELTFDSVDWSLGQLRQPGDTLVILGVITKIRHPLGAYVSLEGTNDKILEYEIARCRMDYLKKLERWRLLCEKKGFNMEVRITAGHPLKDVVVREALELHTTCVVLDKRLRKADNFFLGSLECSVVHMDKNNIGRPLRNSKFDSCADTRNCTPGSTNFAFPLHGSKKHMTGLCGFCVGLLAGNA